jgi:hypothetical protein
MTPGWGIREMKTYSRAIEALKYIEEADLDFNVAFSLRALVIGVVYLQEKYEGISISELKLNDVIDDFIKEDARHTEP